MTHFAHVSDARENSFPVLLRRENAFPIVCVFVVGRIYGNPLFVYLYPPSVSKNATRVSQKSCCLILLYYVKAKLLRAFCSDVRGLERGAILYHE